MKTFLTAILALCLAGSAHGAQAPAPAAPQKPARPAPAQPAPATAAPAPAAPAPVAPPPDAPAARAPEPTPVGDPVNVRYEIRLREEGGPKPSTKTVSMTTSLREVSLIRSNQGSKNPLNVDVWPTNIRDGRVHSRIVIEYTPRTTETPGEVLPALAVRQTVNIWLDSGKPTVISESADPNSDRRLIVEVIATVNK